MTTTCLVNENAIRNLFDSERSRRLGVRFPLVDVSESDEAFLFRAEVPGFDKKDLEVGYEDQILTLRGKRVIDSNGANILKNEGFHGEFERKFRMTDDLDPSKFDAKYRDGILTITIPKSERSKTLEIKVN